MNQNVPTRRMREHPDLQQLKRQAKELLREFRAGEPAAVDEVRAHYHGAESSTFALHHAQLVLAKSYGFESWSRLNAYVRRRDRTPASGGHSCKRSGKGPCDAAMPNYGQHRGLGWPRWGTVMC